MFQHDLKQEKYRLEKELSNRISQVIEKELNAIKEEYGENPKSINIEMINTRTIENKYDHWILQIVEVKIWNMNLLNILITRMETIMI